MGPCDWNFYCNADILITVVRYNVTLQLFIAKLFKRKIVYDAFNTKMEFFQVNSQFNDYKSVMEMKKKYEKASNSLLYKEDCVFLPDRESEFGKRFVYQRLVLRCKAGPERPSQSKGIRNSSTYKKNCPVKVSFLTKSGHVTLLPTVGKMQLTT